MELYGHHPPSTSSPLKEKSKLQSMEGHILEHQ